jgi:hypothetical protein
MPVLVWPGIFNQLKQVYVRYAIQVAKNVQAQIIVMNVILLLNFIL